MTRKLIAGLAAALMIIGVGAAFAYDAAGEKNALAAIAEFKTADPSLEAFFKDAYGYAIFPEKCARGGIGGAAGDGTVFKGGEVIGSSSMSQVTIGLALGGQVYREAIFFKDQAALDDFKNGDYELPRRPQPWRSSPAPRRMPATIVASPSSPWPRAA